MLLFNHVLRLRDCRFKTRQHIFQRQTGLNNQKQELSWLRENHPNIFIFIFSILSPFMLGASRISVCLFTWPETWLWQRPSGVYGVLCFMTSSGCRIGCSVASQIMYMTPSCQRTNFIGLFIPFTQSSLLLQQFSKSVGCVKKNTSEI